MSKPKYYSNWIKATDSKGQTHYVTVCAKVETNRTKELMHESTKIKLKPYTYVDGLVAYEAKRPTRKLTLGLSICHPSDKFNEQVGIELAKKRIERGYVLGELETHTMTMLTPDAVMAEIIVKLNHISANIDKYIGKLF